MPDLRMFSCFFFSLSSLSFRFSTLFFLISLYAFFISFSFVLTSPSRLPSLPMRSVFTPLFPILSRYPHSVVCWPSHYRFVWILLRWYRLSLPWNLLHFHGFYTITLLFLCSLSFVRFSSESFVQAPKIHSTRHCYLLCFVNFLLSPQSHLYQTLT